MGYNSRLMAKYQAVRGTKDIMGATAESFSKLETIARLCFQQFGFSEIRTPTFESLDLFQRSIGETTDVVQKEMYVFEDRGGRQLALRPEGTAGVVRAFIEHHLSQTMPFCKLFYIGSMFRAERPQAGRYREFWQVGAEYFGNASAYADAEVLLLVASLFRALGVRDFTLKLNHLGDKETRARYREVLSQYLSARSSDLCEDCQRRIQVNPLRALDCKIDGPKLKDAPMVDSVWSPASRAHFEKVQQLLTAQHCPFQINLRLVRGLDYYNGTVFEITSTALGAQDALAGGGRYDGLVKELGGPEMPAIGFALGVERTLDVLKAQAAENQASGDALIFVVAQGEKAGPEAFSLLQELRAARIPGVRFDGGFFDKKFGAQFGYADRMGAATCLVIGDDEVASKSVSLRDMKSGTQERLSRDQVISRLRG
jgi:histidyl-tRNA synthetase